MTAPISPPLPLQVLAPPGHGKSAYLKAISGQLSQDLLAPGSGSVEYNGITKKTAKQHGVFLGQLCQHMSQANEHSPFLQVGETLELVYKSAMLDPRPYGLPEEHPLSVRHKNALEDVVELLHLDGCRSTIVGNDMRRGISGGEARRLTIGEALLTNARLLALDEPSTGLDSAVTASECGMRGRSGGSEEGGERGGGKESVCLSCCQLSHSLSHTVSPVFLSFSHLPLPSLQASSSP